MVEVRRRRRRVVLVAVAVTLVAACSGSSGLPQGSWGADASFVVPTVSTLAPPTTAPRSPFVESAAPRGATTSTLPRRDACEPLDALAEVLPPGSVVDGPWPRPEAVAESIGWTPTATAGRTIHLGFDVEGDPTPLPALLDVLDEHGIKTTFFVQGQWAEANGELLTEIVERGHELANHAYGGELLGRASDERIIEELSRTEFVVVATTGVSTQPYFRHPNGDQTDNSIRVAAEAGWSTIHWSGSANDFVPEATIDSMCGALLSGSVAGAILLTHTFHPDIPIAIDRYVREIHRDGLVVVPLSVLLSDDPESFVERG